MTLAFEIELETTLDGSYPIIVRSVTPDHEEYVFQFACNIEELKDLQAEVKKGIAEYNKVEKQRWRQHHSRKMARIRKSMRSVK
jgi:hypothetical protein